MRLRTFATAGLPVAVVIALAAAGCGSSSNSGSGSAATDGGGAASSSGGGYGYGGGATTAPKTTTSAPASAGGKTTVATASTPLGTILVDGSGRTLYLWEADHGTRSTCDGACAQAWPPLTTSGAAAATGSAKATLLGTSRRSDGTMQVTYSGHPLYYFAGDSAAGDTNGQNSDGFGAEWYVVTPAGAADKHGSS